MRVFILCILIITQKCILAQGTLWAWGDNKYGQLGLNNQTRYNSPQQVGEDLWIKVVNGTYTTFGIKSNGTLWAWGYNATARLGLGNYTEFYKIPQKINNDTDWVDIYISSPTGTKIYAFKSDSSLWVWGNEMSVPTMVGNSKKWKKILLNCDSRTIAEQYDGSVWGWGGNNPGTIVNGRLPLNFLGLDSTQDYYDTPVLISSKNDWKKLTGTYWTQIGIKTDGTLWAWGRDYMGNLGLGFKDNNNDTVLKPTKIGLSNDWKDVIGNSSILAIKNDGTIWSWGYNNDYQLGLGDNSNRNRPQQIKPGTYWKEIFRWGAISDKDSIFVWGLGVNGQIGLGDFSNVREPTPFDKYENWNNLKFGRYHSTGLRTSKCVLFTDSLQNDTISVKQTAIFPIANSSNTNVLTFWEGSTIDLSWSKLEQSNRISPYQNRLLIKNSNISNHMQYVRAIRINTENNCKDTTNTAQIIISDTCINVKNDTQLISVTDTLIIKISLNNENSEFDFIKIYPNPTNDYIQIDFGTSVLQKGYSLNIINELGKSVYTDIIKNQTTSLNLNDWTGKGIYYIQIINDIGEIISIRHIILQ